VVKFSGDQMFHQFDTFTVRVVRFFLQGGQIVR
jgi:hypothetical protein